MKLKEDTIGWMLLSSIFLLTYLVNGFPVWLFSSSILITFIISSIFRANNYEKKLFYPILLGIIILQCLMVIFLFKSINFENPTPLFYTIFYVGIGALMVFEVVYADYILHK